MRRAPALLVFTLACFLGSTRAQPTPTGLQTDVTFADYPAVAEASELLRRMASPLAGEEMRRVLATSGRSLNEHSVDLKDARFVVYVPPKPPNGGYGLLVFVPPVPEAALPRGWGPVLDKFGVIFVAAAGSGNEASTVGRREPLALIAEQNLAQRYAIDPSRIYVGGFSGGSHVALHLALGYPDVFRGAMLDAGADPIGDTATPLPPGDLFAAFQARTRLVYVTGEKDSERRAMAADSVSSMRHWCVFDLHEDLIPNAGHVAADAAALARTLQTLDAPARPDAAKLAACQAGIKAELAGALDRVRALSAAGKRDEARKLLLKLDTRFGGLAAPDSVDLGRGL